MYCINKHLHPEIFQGKNKRRHYFEGWYYRISDQKLKHTYAVIPGISIGEWDTHAFIQVIDENHKDYYYHYDICDFQFNEDEFEIMIGENYFSKSRIRLNLVSNDLSIQGDLYFCNIMEYPRSFLRPGDMGPFLHDPCMECYHDIINIQHDIIGHLKIAGNKVDFSGGIGYIEKNWGRSMPKAWIWVQSNHFKPDNASFTLNIGKVRCCGINFLGFIGMFRYKDRIFMFTTYSGASIRRLFHSDNKLRISLKNCRFRLDLSVTYAEGGKLKAPINGQMCRSITESINAVIKLRFTDRTGRILYEGIGTNAGLEIVE